MVANDDAEEEERSSDSCSLKKSNEIMTTMNVYSMVVRMGQDEAAMIEKGGSESEDGGNINLASSMYLRD